MSPERSSSPLQEHQATTPKMSAPASPVAGTPIIDAQSSIALLLAVAQQSTRTNDDDLTSLSWLHERDVLKGINLPNSSPSNENTSPMKITNLLADHSSTSDLDDSSVSAADSNSSLSSPTPSGGVPFNKHPYHVPYDPMVHTSSKPPYSFSCLIFMAIEDSKSKALPVKDIYAWILSHFPYFKNAPTGWKNSVRHNLSLNKCFQKVEKAPNLGKGSLWTVDPHFRPNLLQALTRSPFHPCSTLDPTLYFGNGNKEKTRLTRSSAMWGKKLKIEDESLDEVDAAAVMLSLKNGPRIQDQRIKQIITSSPSEDHTYSASESLIVSADEAFESDDERYLKKSTRRKIDFSEEEERKSKEGAETLLSLAGVPSRKRHNSQNQDYNHRRKKIQNEIDEKPTHFRPRLLRAKRKEKITNNNNIVKVEDEWVKHRRELEGGQKR